MGGGSSGGLGQSILDALLGWLAVAVAIMGVWPLVAFVVLCAWETGSWLMLREHVVMIVEVPAPVVEPPPPPPPAFETITKCVGFWC